ncbi:MAG: hypothetical protein JXK07_15435 [Spirochaetes bacterium]|nr:hypothetical protein [Spirochaetota bacterium]
MYRAMTWIILGLCILPISCNTAKESETAKERAQEITFLITQEEQTEKAIALYESTKPLMKPELDNELKKNCLWRTTSIGGWLAI